MKRAASPPDPISTPSSPPPPPFATRPRFGRIDPTTTIDVQFMNVPFVPKQA